MGLSLKYVLLGMVAEGPAHGYELQRRIDEQLPSFNYTAGAVYPALDRLEKARLIAATGVSERSGAGHRSSRVTYSATADGLARLERWICAPTPPENSRDALFAKVVIARSQHLPRLIELARGQEVQLCRQLGSLVDAPAPAWAGPGRVPLPLVGATLVRSAEARRLSSTIESLQEIRQALQHELCDAHESRHRERGGPSMAFSLKYVLLGMLSGGPAYGYELQRRIDERLPSFNCTAGAVYGALDRLEHEQMIRTTGVKETLRTVRGSPRVMYSATPLGLTELERWMHAPTPPQNSRDELFSKLVIARPQHVPRLLEMARILETQLRSDLGDLREAPAPAWTGRGRPPLQLVGAALARSAEARRLSAATESLQEIREALEHELRGAPSPRR